MIDVKTKREGGAGLFQLPGCLEISWPGLRIKCEGLVISNRTLALNFLHAGCEIPLPELHSSSKGILSGNGEGHWSLAFY